MRDATERRTETEAATWFARLSQLSVTTDALRDFRAWKQTPGNAEAYARIEQTWDAAGRLRTDPDLARATAAALARRPPRTGRNLRRTAALALTAATLAGVAGLGLVLWSAQGTTYRTGVGEQRLLVLPDGTRMRLNTDSVARVRFTRRARQVDLARGEAFFEVRHDAARPFTVAADGTRVTDLGTRFDVRRMATRVQVTLVEGQVRVSRPEDGAQATLAPNQQLTVARSGALRAKPVDAAQASSWTTGRLVFHDLPLQAAIAEINRYAPRKVVLDGPAALGQRPISGVFETGDTEAFVAGVTSLFPLRAAPAPDGSIRLTARAPAPPA